MAVDRLTPTPTNYGSSIDGPTYSEQVNEEIAALWSRIIVFLSAVAGTNTITATATPAPAAYAQGQTYDFIPAVTNTGATTLNINSLGAVSVRTRAGAALTGGELVAGTLVTVVHDGTNFRIKQDVAAAAAAASPRALFANRPAAGTDGGSATVGAWNTYPLTAQGYNNISGASRTGNVITLPSGTYYFEAEATFYKTNYSKLRLRNTSDGTSATADGTTPRAADGSSVGVVSTLKGQITLGATKNLELQYRVDDGEPTNGLGTAMNVGEPETFGWIEFIKIA